MTVTNQITTDCWDDMSLSIERRLRAHGSFTVGGSQWFPDPVCAEAANEIERLRAENNRLLETNAAAHVLLAAIEKLKWVSVEKDNMEFACRTTCFVVDEINAAIASLNNSDGRSP